MNALEELGAVLERECSTEAGKSAARDIRRLAKAGALKSDSDGLDAEFWKAEARKWRVRAEYYRNLSERLVGIA